MTEIATTSIETIVQLITHGMFERIQTCRTLKVSTLTISSHKKRGKEFFFYHSFNYRI